MEGSSFFFVGVFALILVSVNDLFMFVVDQVLLIPI